MEYLPSPKVFADYIKSEENKEGSKIVAFKFRNKDKGWNQTGLQLGTYAEYADRKQVRKYPAFKDRYMNAFLSDICLRPSCYECSFKVLPKNYADITIGNFWGVDRVASTLNDKKGTSLIIVNTVQGEKLWNSVRESFEYKQVDFETAIGMNKPLIQPAKLEPIRENFFRDYYDKGYVEKKYMSAMFWLLHKMRRLVNSLRDR